MEKQQKPTLGRPHRACRQFRFWILIVAAWAAMSGPVWAQAGPAGGEESSAPSWALPYFAVIFGVLLGLIIVLNPSRRRDRAKPDKDSDKKKKAAPAH